MLSLALEVPEGQQRRIAGRDPGSWIDAPGRIFRNLKDPARLTDLVNEPLHLLFPVLNSLLLGGNRQQQQR